ncbi:hypothetical protein Shyhy02_72930 [Streptomyces hygroscopicus subsp. hygroscopicus]|nr:hypothetical protein Shyhy02_72930 [Streptomyces hygroscopicus subsp. hygroscopicus]
MTQRTRRATAAYAPRRAAYALYRAPMGDAHTGARPTTFREADMGAHGQPPPPDPQPKRPSPWVPRNPWNPWHTDGPHPDVSGPGGGTHRT